MVGFVASVAIHVASFFFNITDRFPTIFWLHIVILPIFLFAMVVSRSQWRERPTTWRKALPYAPRWLRILTVVCFIYAGVNFAIFMAYTLEGSPERRDDGTFIVENHGQFVREIDEAEYHRLQAFVARGFSGHWMLFYTVSAAMLLSATHNKWK